MQTKIKLKCTDCKKTFSNIKTLQTHITSKHPPKPANELKHEDSSKSLSVESNSDELSYSYIDNLIRSISCNSKLISNSEKLIISSLWFLIKHGN